MDPEEMEVTHVDYDQDLIAKIPEEMREAIFAIIDNTVQKKVEQEVNRKMEIITIEVKALKEMIE